MLDRLATFVLMGLAAGGLAVFVRRLPVPARLLDWRIPVLGNRFGDKPWSCAVCMGGWCSFPVIGFWPEPVGLTWAPLAWLTALAVAAVVFTLVVPPDVDLSGLGGSGE